MKKLFLVLSFLTMKSLINRAAAQTNSPRDSADTNVCACKEKIYVSGENQFGLNDVDGTALTFIYSSNYYIQQNTLDSTKWKWAGYIYFTKNYLEAIPLLTYVPNEHIRVSAGIGFETKKPHWRAATMAVYWDSLNIAKALFEIGGGRNNYRYALSYDRSMSRILIGAISQRYFGTGFRFGVVFSKHLVVQAGPLLTSNTSSGVIGMNAMLFIRYAF